MKKIIRIGLLAGGVAAMFAAATPAFATPPAGSTGFDETPNVIVVGGSDTNYTASNLIAGIYNQSEGCDTNNSTSPADACAPTVAGGKNDTTVQWRQTTPAKFANWDHDQVVNAYPIGSGNGRACLTGAASPTCTNTVDVARSSSGIGAAATNSNFAFGSEQIAVVAANPAVKARTTSTLAVTLAQLQTIYSTTATVCNTVTWADLGDTGANKTDVVVPFGMNSGSGTYGTFNTYLGLTADNGACVVGTPFENDVQELQVAPQLAVWSAGTGIWWMSGATYTNYPVLSNGVSAMSVDGAALYATGYPTALARTVSYVTLDSGVAWCTGAGVPNAACTAANTLGGTGGGKQGAAREFIRWVCRATAATNILDRTVQSNTTGTLYNSQVNAAITKAGFRSVTGANFGRCLAST